jgi:hypothetical protein
VLLAIYYHNNENNEDGTSRYCNACALKKNKYKILVGNNGITTLIESNTGTLENSTNPVKALQTPFLEDTRNFLTK